MVKIGRAQRHELLKKRIEENPFINDEELAEAFEVSIATVRLDRMALGIPELRIRIKQRAVAAGPAPPQLHLGVVGRARGLPGRKGRGEVCRGRGGRRPR